MHSDVGTSCIFFLIVRIDFEFRQPFLESVNSTIRDVQLCGQIVAIGTN